MALALRSGVPADWWIDNPRAMFTAVELLGDEAREMARRG